MRSIQDWYKDQNKHFKGMESSSNIKDILNFFEDKKIVIGDTSSYYTYSDGSIETRANIYYKDIALFKIHLNITLGKEQLGHIKVEKVRRAENDTIRLQDLSHRLSSDWADIFEVKYFEFKHDSNILDFKNKVENIRTYIDKLKLLMHDFENGLDLQLTSVTVNNFKNISQPTSLDFNTNIKILVGPNNAGKSSLIQGILLGYQSLVQLFKQDRLKFDEEGFLKTQSDGVRIEKFPFLVGNIRELFNVNVSNFSQYVEFVVLKFSGNKYIKLGATLVGEYYSVRLDDSSHGITKEMLAKFLDKPITLIPSFFTVIIDEERKSPARYNSLLKTGNYNQLFRNILLDLSEADEGNHASSGVIPQGKFDLLKQVVNEIFEVKDLEVEFNPEEDEFIKVTYAHNSNNKNNKQRRLDISTLGMGSLQFIQVIAQVLLGRPSLILLDEPDAHLHSKLQVKIIDVLNQLSTDYNMKFLIATHSKDFINNVNFNQVVSFNNEGTLLSLKDSSEYLHMFETLGITTEEIIGIHIGKRIIVVEGVDDVAYIKKICEKMDIDKECNYHLVNFLPLEGRGNIINNQLDIFLRDLKNDDDFKKLAIFDRDYRTEEEQIRDGKKLENKGFEVVNWTKKELENYFILPELIIDLINNEYSATTPVSIEDIENIINEVYEEDFESIVFEIEKNFNKVKQKEIKDDLTNHVIKETELGKNEQLEIRKAAKEYVLQLEKVDYLSGKKILNKIRTQLILKNTPTQEKFVLSIINRLTSATLNPELQNMLDKIKELSK